MNNIPNWLKPKGPIVFLAVLLFAFLMLIQTSAFVESRSIAKNSFTFLLTWPDVVYEKVRGNYFENRLPYNEEIYQRLSQQKNQRVTHEFLVNEPDYITIYKQGNIYGFLKASLIFTIIILYIFNFYVLALILYWLGRGVKMLVKSK